MVMSFRAIVFQFMYLLIPGGSDFIQKKYALGGVKFCSLLFVLLQFVAIPGPLWSVSLLALIVGLLVALYLCNIIEVLPNTYLFYVDLKKNISVLACCLATLLLVINVSSMASQVNWGKAADDGMAPMITKGDTLFFSKTNAPKKNELAIIEAPFNGQLYFRRVLAVQGDDYQTLMGRLLVNDTDSFLENDWKQAITFDANFSGTVPQGKFLWVAFGELADDQPRYGVLENFYFVGTPLFFTFTQEGSKNFTSVKKL